MWVWIAGTFIRSRSRIYKTEWRRRYASEPDQTTDQKGLKMSEETDLFYRSIALEFAARIEEIFTSEATLEACFKKHHSMLPFDRTDHWSGLLYKELREVWDKYSPVGAPMTSYDRLAVLPHLLDLLDFNLYTQVALNLQNWSVVQYDNRSGEKDLAALREKWEKHKAAGYPHGMGPNLLDPFDPKAKMRKDATTDIQREYNTDLSAIKALNILAAFNPTVSFRVSPKGSTPAFADSRNFSMIGQGGDQFIRVKGDCKLWFITWQPGETPNVLKPQEDGGFKTEGIEYPFYSKSGGEILNEVLFARGLATTFYSTLMRGEAMEDTAIMPRMNSLMIIANSAQSDNVKDTYGWILKVYPFLKLHEGKRQ